jgi:hypothetical protein
MGVYNGEKGFETPRERYCLLSLKKASKIRKNNLPQKSHLKDTEYNILRELVNDESLTPNFMKNPSLAIDSPVK